MDELEQEVASIIKFVLDASGNPKPYYWNVPRSFVVPSAFFPTPEIDTGGETFLTYYMDYVWYIKFFGNTSRAAYNLGLKALTALKGKRHLVPLLKPDGTREGGGLRLNKPALRTLDDGAAQLTVSWRSRRPYDYEDVLLMQTYDLSMWAKEYQQPAITEAMESALTGYHLLKED